MDLQFLDLHIVLLYGLLLDVKEFAQGHLVFLQLLDLLVFLRLELLFFFLQLGD